MDKPDNTISIQSSNSPEDACDAFLVDLRGWIYACIERYSNQSPTGSHDQLTYVTGWEPYMLISGDPHTARFLTQMQAQTASYFTSKDMWRHGYWRMQEAHHGTEHFELFLGFMTRVARGNATTMAQLVDAAEHIGNWCADIPEWFDYSTGLFRSLYFGTDGVRTDALELNMPDHLRCANLLILAYDVTNDPKYCELAETYAGRWASAICTQNHPLPIGITRDGVLYELSGSGEATYRSFVGMAGALDTDLDRAENILASGGIQLFLRLWEESHRAVFLHAVERLLTVLSSALSDPDAGPVADAIRRYRRVTGRRNFDGVITQIVNDLSPFDVHTIGVDLPPNLAKRPSGVGKRSDMPVWHDNHCPRRHNPILLSVAAEILNEQALATRAVDLAHAYFSLAVRRLPDGREHGCAARTISAIARGHGRNNHAGMTTAVLLPTMQHIGMLQSD